MKQGTRGLPLKPFLWACLLFFLTTAAICPVAEDGQREPTLLRYQATLSSKTLELLPGQTKSVTLSVTRDGDVSDAPPPETFLPWAFVSEAGGVQMTIQDPTEATTQVTVTAFGDPGQLKPAREWTLEKGVVKTSFFIDNSQVPFSYVKFSGTILTVKVILDEELEAEIAELLPPNGPRLTTSLAPNLGSIDADGGFVTTQFSIGNRGTETLVVTEVSLVPADDPNFSLVSGPLPLTLQRRGGALRFSELTFNPESPGTKTAQIRIRSNDVVEPTKTIAITGRGF